MNSRPATPWLRLAAAARRAPARGVDDLGVEAPAGFATRVVALSPLGSSAGLFGGVLRTPRRPRPRFRLRRGPGGDPLVDFTRRWWRGGGLG